MAAKFNPSPPSSHPPFLLVVKFTPLVPSGHPPPHLAVKVTLDPFWLKNDTERVQISTFFRAIATASFFLPMCYCNVCHLFLFAVALKVAQIFFNDASAWSFMDYWSNIFCVF